MKSRVDWVDVAKGFCIIFVVMMHSTLGVEKAAGADGWMNYVVEFARPFRMPDFFLIAGLFIGLRIDAPWRLYLDRKVVHFAYFYALWLTIQFAIKAPGFAAEIGWGGVLRDYLTAFVEPWGTLWFIYHLALFCVIVRLLKRVPWPIVWVAAASLEILHIETGSVLIDETASRFVYFYSGYVFSAHVLRFAEKVAEDRVSALLGLGLWGVLNATIVFAGYSTMPFVSLVLGFAGAVAVVSTSVLLAGTRAAVPLRWLGEHSIVVYLAFFFPMAVSRAVLLKTGIITDIGTISVLVTAAGVLGPVVFYGLVQWTGWGRFLFERPAWARIDGPYRRRDRAALQPAE
ncbi:acyltransferase family protein [Propylenella binzhouense]|uniref:Acyltransferase n=1 Tax=Propylenella binzhouense TaxID=2555902 RepID=A0A964T780_9HYPH|nr:acyltransferase family protein [Propylenella binzhouense]MYZ49109.1 acyltransferase [Propylenella binzhouense]